MWLMYKSTNFLSNGFMWISKDGPFYDFEKEFSKNSAEIAHHILFLLRFCYHQGPVSTLLQLTPDCERERKHDSTGHYFQSPGHVISTPGVMDIFIDAETSFGELEFGKAFSTGKHCRSWICISKQRQSMTFPVRGFMYAWKSIKMGTEDRDKP